MGLDQVIIDLTNNTEVGYFRKCMALQDYVLENCECIDSDPSWFVHEITSKDMVGALIEMTSSLDDFLDKMNKMDLLLCDILGKVYNKEHAEYALWLRDFEKDLYDYKNMLNIMYVMFSQPLHKYKIIHSW